MSRRWVWIIVAFVAVCVIGVIAFAGASAYFVASHLQVQRLTTEKAADSFDAERSRFKGQAPLLRIDPFDHTVSTPRPTQQIPTSSETPRELHIYVWSPEKGETVQIALPFWLLRFTRHKMTFMSGDRAVDLQDLHLDVAELERIGPALVLDETNSRGQRILIWTE